MLLSDIPFIFKLLRQNAAFTTTCVIVIAVGIAVALPLISYNENAFYKALPFDQGNRVAGIKDISKPRAMTHDVYEYEFIKNNQHSFSVLGAFTDARLPVSDGAAVELHTVSEIDPQLLRMTGVSPVVGRLLDENDSAAGVQSVALISAGFRRNFFPGGEEIIGRRIIVEGTARTIVGVMPEGFGFPFSQEIWLPLTLPENPQPGEGRKDLVVAGRLADGVSFEEATGEIGAIQRQLQDNWPDVYDDQGPAIVTRFAAADSSYSSRNFSLLIAFFILILIPVNLTNLFITRGSQRIQELAIRSAVGATPARVAQALLLETLLISIMGFIAGILLSWFTLTFLGGIFSNLAARRYEAFWWDMSLEPGLIAIAFFSTVAIWLLSSIVPLVKIYRVDLNDVLNTGVVDVKGSQNGGLNKTMVNLQIVLGSVLMILTLILLLNLSSTADESIAGNDNIYHAELNLPNESVSPSSRFESISAFERQLSEIPGILRTGFTAPWQAIEYLPETENATFNEQLPEDFLRPVSAGYFDIFNLPLTQGRNFGTEDTAGSLPVVIVSEDLADRYWPGDSAVGKRLRSDPNGGGPWLTIIGVTPPHRQGFVPTTGNQPLLYRPVSQLPLNSLSLFIQSSPGVNQAAFAPAINNAVQDLPEATIESLQSLQGLIDKQTKTSRAMRKICITLFLFAVYLTTISTYGLASRSVLNRHKEAGIRMALGADQVRVILTFLKEGVVTLIFGLTASAVLAVAIGYYLLSRLGAASFGVVITSCLAVSLVMAVIILLANFIPARKLADMEPGDALRYE